MGTRGPRVARDGGGTMIAVGQRDPLLASPDPAAPCARQQALVEQRAGPCPAAVISFNQTNMIEPQATLQWRHGHSLLLLVRNPNPSIHRRDSRSIYILRLTAVVPGWMRCVWQKKRGCKHAAVLLWSASQVQIRERAEKMAPRPCYRRLLVAWVAGAVPPVAICVPRPEPGSSRSNVLPVPGKDLGCGGSYLPPQVQLAQPTHSSPALS